MALEQGPLIVNFYMRGMYTACCVGVRELMTMKWLRRHGARRYLVADKQRRKNLYQYNAWLKYFVPIPLVAAEYKMRTANCIRCAIDELAIACRQITQVTSRGIFFEMAFEAPPVHAYRITFHFIK